MAASSAASVPAVDGVRTTLSLPPVLVPMLVLVLTLVLVLDACE